MVMKIMVALTLLVAATPPAGPDVSASGAVRARLQIPVYDTIRNLASPPSFFRSSATH